MSIELKEWIDPEIIDLGTENTSYRLIHNDGGWWSNQASNNNGGIPGGFVYLSNIDNTGS